MRTLLFLSVFVVFASAQYAAIFQTYSDSNCQKPYKNSAGVSTSGIPGTYKLASGQNSIALYSPDSQVLKKGLEARLEISGKKYIGTFPVRGSAVKCYNSKTFGNGKHGSKPLSAIKFQYK